MGLFLSQNNSWQSFLEIQSIDDTADKFYVIHQLVVDLSTVLNSFELSEHVVKAVKNRLVDTAVALHVNFTVEQLMGDVILFGHPGQGDGKVDLLVFFRRKTESNGLTAENIA